MNLHDKKILIIGMGRSGQASWDAVLRLGGKPYPYDDYRDEYYRRENLPDEPWNLVVLSPGVPPSLLVVREAFEKGAEIIGELELAYRLGKGIFIAITGTNGKTTTTTLVGKIFSDAGRDSVVAGNIGDPVVTEAVAATDETFLITEVSSFQLETTREFKPRIAAILNLTPDHLDRHGDMEHYGAAKARIFANQEGTDVLVYNQDDPLVAKLAETSRAALFPFSRLRTLPHGVFVEDGNIVVCDGGERTVLMEVKALRIPGLHNLENALAAVAIAWRGGIAPGDIADSLRSFEGVAHRLESVAAIGGVRYVNDSKGTNPDAAIKAIEAVDTDIVLIAGGYDKHADYREWIRRFDGKVRHLLLMGETAADIQRAAEQEGFGPITRCADMKECVGKAAEFAAAGDTVLLSPACASWDMYRCFEDRGADFKSCVRELTN